MGDLDDELADLALALSPFGGPSDAASLRRACESDELAQRLISALPSGDRTALLGFGVDAARPRQRSLLGELLASCRRVPPLRRRADADASARARPARLRGARPLSARCAPGPSRKAAPADTLRRLRRRRGRCRARRRRPRPPPRRRRRRPPPTAGGTPLIAADALGAARLEALDRVNQALREVRVRREMLLKQLDVLADSFSWSERAEQRGETEAALAARRAALPPPSTIEPRDALAPPPTCSSCARALSEGASVKKVRIGKVPDRGGRRDPFPPRIVSAAGGGRAPRRWRWRRRRSRTRWRPRQGGRAQRQHLVHDAHSAAACARARGEATSRRPRRAVDPDGASSATAAGLRVRARVGEQRRSAWGAAACARCVEGLDTSFASARLTAAS